MHCIVCRQQPDTNTHKPLQPLTNIRSLPVTTSDGCTNPLPTSNATHTLKEYYNNVINYFNISSVCFVPTNGYCAHKTNVRQQTYTQICT